MATTQAQTKIAEAINPHFAGTCSEQPLPNSAEFSSISFQQAQPHRTISRVDIQRRLVNIRCNASTRHDTPPTDGTSTQGVRRQFCSHLSTTRRCYPLFFRRPEVIICHTHPDLSVRLLQRDHLSRDRHSSTSTSLETGHSTQPSICSSPSNFSQSIIATLQHLLKCWSYIFLFRLVSHNIILWKLLVMHPS